jgi:hypothetical protein
MYPSPTQQFSNMQGHQGLINLFSSSILQELHFQGISFFGISIFMFQYFQQFFFLTVISGHTKTSFIFTYLWRSDRCRIGVEWLILQELPHHPPYTEGRIDKIPSEVSKTSFTS